MEALLPGGRQCTLHETRECLATRYRFGEHGLLAVTSLGSGSSGNALLVRTPGAVLLVDCGVGLRRLLRALDAVGLSMADVDAVLISHEHSDHIRELPRFVIQGTAVFSTRGSARAANVPTRLWEEIRAEQPLRLADIEVVAIPVCHDAVDPCGFLIRSGAGSVTVCTDLGCASLPRQKRLPSLTWSSWKRTMTRQLLRRGPYPAAPAAPHPV